MEQENGTIKKGSFPTADQSTGNEPHTTNPKGASCIYNYTIATPRKSTTTKGACFIMLIILILWTIGIFAVSHYLKHRRYHKSDVKFFRIYSGVHDLAQIVNQLQELEELQTQIELARFHHLKGVTVSLPDNLSHDHSHTLLINGHDRNSKALMQLVLDERDRLRDTLEKKIKALAKNGTTQLRPDLAMKEALECSTMRVRGAHFTPIETTSPEDLENENDCNAVIKTDDFNFFFAGENGAEGGEEE